MTLKGRYRDLKMHKQRQLEAGAHILAHLAIAGGFNETFTVVCQAELNIHTHSIYQAHCDLFIQSIRSLSENNHIGIHVQSSTQERITVFILICTTRE